MTAFLKGVLALLARLLPFGKSAAEKVAPEIQRQIDEILKRAHSEVDTIKASKSVAAIKKQLEDDIAAVKDTAAHHVALIEAAAKRAIADAESKLPTVSAMLSQGSVPVDPSLPHP